MSRAEARTAVLVVDDDAMMHRVWKRMLGEEEFELHVCGDATSALAALRAAAIDVVITDVDMPGLSGLELLDRIKADLPGVEVVVMSGRGRVNDMTRAARAGAYAYVAKPFHDLDRCVQMVRRAGRRSRSTRQSDGATPLAS